MANQQNQQLQNGDRLNDSARKISGMAGDNTDPAYEIEGNGKKHNHNDGRRNHPNLDGLLVERFF
jgi:hypothetical protein